MTRLTQLLDLKRLTQLRLEAAQTEFARISREEDALRESLAVLRAGPPPMPDDAEGPILVAGFRAEFNWRLWAEGRRKTIQAELALVLARKQEAQVQMRRAFGKDAAVKELITSERRRQSVLTSRRQDHAS